MIRKVVGLMLVQNGQSSCEHNNINNNLYSSHKYIDLFVKLKKET